MVSLLYVGDEIATYNLSGGEKLVPSAEEIRSGFEPKIADAEGDLLVQLSRQKYQDSTGLPPKTEECHKET